MNTTRAPRSRQGRIAAFVIAFAVSATASANQIIFIDFDGESPKGDKDLFLPTDKTKKFAVLKEGAGMAFDVTKIGFAAGDANAVKTAILDQVRADFPAMTGLDFKNSLDHNLADFAGQNVTVLDVVSGKTQIMAEVDTSAGKVTVTRDALGISQKIDTENMDKKDAGWILADVHDLFADKDKNRIQVANTISHELGHLLGLEHKHGSAGSIMEPHQDGTDRPFKKDELDVLKKAMCYEAPVQKQQKSKRLRWGDFDWAGAIDRFNPGTPIHAMSTAAEQEKTAGDIVDYMSAPDTRIKQLASEWALAEVDDAFGTDRIVSGETVRLPLPSNMFMDPALSRAIFFEMGHYNLVDSANDPNDDILVQLIIHAGLGPPMTFNLPNIFLGLDGSGGDGVSTSMGLYDETAYQMIDPSQFSLLSQATLNGGLVELQITVPSVQSIGIDYAGLEVLFVPEANTLILACCALAAAVAARRSNRKA